MVAQLTKLRGTIFISRRLDSDFSSITYVCRVHALCDVKLRSHSFHILVGSCPAKQNLSFLNNLAQRVTVRTSLLSFKTSIGSLAFLIDPRDGHFDTHYARWVPFAILP